MVRITTKIRAQAVFSFLVSDSDVHLLIQWTARYILCSFRAYRKTKSVSLKPYMKQHYLHFHKAALPVLIHDVMNLIASTAEPVLYSGREVAS